jgi:hypothetical protein
MKTNGQMNKAQLKPEYRGLAHYYAQEEHDAKGSYLGTMQNERKGCESHLYGEEERDCP